MKIKRLEHVAITVKDMDKARETWVDVLGIGQEYEEQIGQTKLAMLPVGETYLELLQATGPDSPVNAWMDKAGEGLWHLCFEVDDIDNAINSYTALLEPLMLGFMGLLVGYVVIACFLPLYQLVDAF